LQKIIKTTMRGNIGMNNSSFLLLEGSGLCRSSTCLILNGWAMRSFSALILRTTAFEATDSFCFLNENWRRKEIYRKRSTSLSFHRLSKIRLMKVLGTTCKGFSRCTCSKACRILRLTYLRAISSKPFAPTNTKTFRKFISWLNQ